MADSAARDMFEEEGLKVEAGSRAPEQPENVELSEFQERQAEAAVPRLKEAINQFGEGDMKRVLEHLNTALDNGDESVIGPLLCQLDQNPPMCTIRSLWNHLPTLVQKMLYYMPTSPISPLPICQILVEAGFMDINKADGGKTTEASIKANSRVQGIVTKIIMAIVPEAKALQPLIMVCEKLKKHQVEYRLLVRNNRNAQEKLNAEKNAHGKKPEKSAEAPTNVIGAERVAARRAEVEAASKLKSKKGKKNSSPNSEA